MSGRVTDPFGLPVAGAGLVAEHLTSGLRGETRTDASGSFGFGRLPAGTFNITVAKAGFFATSFELELESGKVLDLVLTPLTVLEQEIQVTARPLPIDPERMSPRQEIGENQIQHLPYTGRRNFLNAATYTPGTLRDNLGRIHFHGSGPGEIRYVLDGIDLTDPSSGAMTASIPIDAVESVELDLVGYSAEYGKASGGVVRANSQLIGSEFRWDLTDFVPGLNFKRLAVGEFSPRLQVSGPLIDDKLWGMYSGSVRYVQTYHDDLPPEEDEQNETRFDQLARMQWKLREGQTVSLHLLHSSTFLGNLGLDRQHPVETTTNFLDRNTTWAVSHRHAQGRALLETRFQWSRGRETQLGKGDRPLEIHPSGWKGNFFLDREGRHERFHLAHTVAWERTWAGIAHRFKSGMAFDYVRAEESIERRSFFTFQSNGSPDARIDFLGPSSAAIRNREYAAFFQDRIVFHPRFQVEAGLRLDRESVVGRTNLAPRLAVGFQPFRDNRARVTAGIGLFYDSFLFENLFLARMQRRSTVWFDGSAPSGFDPVDLRVGDTLYNPHGVHWNIGWAQEWAPRWVTELNYIEKRGRRQVRVAALGAADGFVLEVNNSGKSRYRALELTLDRPIRSDLRFYVSYVHSRSEGRPSMSFDFPDPSLERVQIAPTAWDAPHRLVAWGYFPMLYKTRGALAIEARSGFPFTITDGLQNSVEAYHSERFPTFFVVNFNIEREIPFFGGRRLAVRVGATNLLDRFNPRSVDAVWNSPTFGTFSESSGRSYVARLRLVK